MHCLFCVMLFNFMNKSNAVMIIFATTEQKNK